MIGEGRLLIQIVGYGGFEKLFEQIDQHDQEKDVSIVWFDETNKIKGEKYQTIDCKIKDAKRFINELTRNTNRTSQIVPPTIH